MKFSLTLVILATTLFSSCKKDQAEDNKVAHYLHTGYFTDYYSSVSYWSYNQFYDCYSAGGPDSMAIKSIDLDKDGCLDFTIGIAHTLQWVTGGDPCGSGIEYYINIAELGSHADVAVTSGVNSSLRNFSEGEVIDDHVIWRDINRLLVNHEYNTGNSHNYIFGLRLKTPDGYQYGWIAIERYEFNISISSHTVNLTPDMTISAGQYQ